MSAMPPADHHATATFLGHPRGLFILFFTELWERFSFYGMRALLIFYLTKQFLFSDERAGMLYGAYIALVFVSPLVGGWLADRYLGARKAVLFGGIVIACGHILLGLDALGGDRESATRIFLAGMAVIVVGTGFLKANVSVLVGQLYPRDDMRRDPAYTIFYMGINLGGALGPLVCGLLGETIGWSWGFGAAALGMILGIIVFVMGRPLLQGQGEAPDPAWLASPLFGIPREYWLYASAMPFTAAMLALLASPATVGYLLSASGFAMGIGLVAYACLKLDPAARGRLLVAIFLLVVQPVFWGLFEQTGSSLNLFIDRHVDRTMFGITVPASLFQAVGPFSIFLLAPFFAWLWLKLGRRGLEPSAPAKFGLAIIQVGAGFLLLVGAGMMLPGAKMPMLFILLLYLLHTMGELCLSPVGLAAMSRLSPPHMLGLMMGTWFLATAGGNFMSGVIAAAIGASAGADQASTVLAAYGRIGGLAMLIGLAVLALSPWIGRLMKQGGR
ncbi:peptide MFS transporter [Sphingobium yanoikuyae]|uniref:peptide MFS transporter n=1 Tax=Sphingobium yanoikuyae TaxID=13690 RepID=UPI0022DE11E1|nr:peptide MFS transporter [Sphingobium yanoikuyae]WBQ18398.1 peptide MFS transporter [Sphingobium yanoikuyae]